MGYKINELPWSASQEVVELRSQPWLPGSELAFPIAALDFSQHLCLVTVSESLFICLFVV